MIVQIYEIQTPNEAEQCIELCVDHIGSVLLSKEEWQNTSLKEVMRVCEDAGVKSSMIPLFNDRKVLYQAIDFYHPDYIHFCDSLVHSSGGAKSLAPAVDLQVDIKNRYPEIGIIRSLPFPSGGARVRLPWMEIAKRLETLTDIFLADTWIGKDPVDGYIGITGEPSDWQEVGSLCLDSRIPVILAGGLSPENVYEALEKAFPWGADSCTGTNATDASGRPIRFRKDFRKVAEFVNEVRRFEHALCLKQEEMVSRNSLNPRKAHWPSTETTAEENE